MRIKLDNRTPFLTADIRAIVRAAAKAVGANGDKTIDVVNARGWHVTGWAYYGHRKREARRIRLRLPKSAGDKVAEVGAVVAHELMHTLGVRHADMTSDQRRCTAAFGAFAAELPLRRSEAVAAPEAPEDKETAAERGARLVAKRAAHARAMLKRAATRSKRARTIERIEAALAAAARLGGQNPVDFSPRGWQMEEGDQELGS